MREATPSVPAGDTIDSPRLVLRDGRTRILFSGHEARGDFGDCIGRVAARTKLARDERLAFKM